MITHLFSGLAVSDFKAARDWYERLFGRPPDAVPKEGEAIWHLAGAASIYITVDEARAGSGLVTLAVANLDEQRAHLLQRGVAFDDGAEGNGMPTVLVTDADGNTIKFFEDPAGE